MRALWDGQNVELELFQVPILHVGHTTGKDVIDEHCYTVFAGSCAHAGRRMDTLLRRFLPRLTLVRMAPYTFLFRDSHISAAVRWPAVSRTGKARVHLHQDGCS